MNIVDAKKILIDIVQLSIEESQLIDEIREKEKLIKTLTNSLEEKQAEQYSLENNKVRQMVLVLMGKKEEYLQDAQNEVRRCNSELLSAQFELESLHKKSEEIQQTTKEMETVCQECMKVIGEESGQEIRTKFLAIMEVPQLCATISEKMSALKIQLNKSYSIWQVGEPTASCLDGNASNRGRAMRKHSKVIENGVNEVVGLLNTYNLYVPDEIKVDFHDKWLEDDTYWDNQPLPDTSLQLIRKVEEWFNRLNWSWKGMKKQQTATMQKLQEEVLAYLNE